MKLIFIDILQIYNELIMEIMEKTIKEIYQIYQINPEDIINKSVKILGRVYTTRLNGDDTISFVHLHDGSGVNTLQCVTSKSTYTGDDWEPSFINLHRGSTMIVSGTIIKSPAKGQEFELVVEKCHYVGHNLDPGNYPLASRGFISRDTLRLIPHMRHHRPQFMVIQKIKQKLYKSWHDTMEQQGIGEIQPTLITFNECEAGANPFTVTTLSNEPDYSKDFFGCQTYMTVSSQLHLEATVCGTLTHGYCMTTAFRAEPSTGPLHLAEFLMPEWELVNCTLESNMRVAERSIKYCLEQIIKHCSDELVFLQKQKFIELDHEHKQLLEDHKSKKKSMKKQDWVKEKQRIDMSIEELKSRQPLLERLQKYVDIPFVVKSHHDCVEQMLKDAKDDKVEFNVLPTYDGDLTKEHERYITEKMHDHIPVFVINFPKKIKAFYMPVVNKGDDVEYVECFDLLFPFVGEVAGASTREHDYYKLEKRIDECNLDKKSLQWYLDLRKYGSIPHGGGGLGFGRLMIVITDIFNIKDMQEFPRSYGSQIIG